MEGNWLIEKCVERSSLCNKLKITKFLSRQIFFFLSGEGKKKISDLLIINYIFVIDQLR